MLKVSTTFQRLSEEQVVAIPQLKGLLPLAKGGYLYVRFPSDVTVLFLSYVVFTRATLQAPFLFAYFT